MELEQKIELNKEIRTYKGENTFLTSLKKQLKSNKYLEKVNIGKRNIRILSERQYKTAKSLLKDLN
jgi:hypothetical protein